MKALAIELDDRAVCVARAGIVLAGSPAVVFDGSSGKPAGSGAWHSLRSHPTAVSSRHLHSVLTQEEVSDRAFSLVAADLSRRFIECAPNEGERIRIAAPAIADARGLGTMLGILSGLSLQVDAFVDSAAATTAALGLERGAIVLELGLHHIAATAVDVGGGIARRRRSVASGRGGLIELYQSWLEFIGTAMVKRTRFDPLHDASTEQRLFDALAQLVRDVEETGSTKAVLSSGAESFEVELSRDQFALAAEPVSREVLRLVHELRPAGASVSLVMPAQVRCIPGLREHIEQFVGCELIGVPDGFAAAATSLIDLQERPPGQPTHLLRKLPLQSQDTLGGSASRERLGARKAGAAPPTHLLLDGRALAIGSDSLVVGRAPGPASSITLPDGLAGVSRRHCTFVRDGTQLVLLDHSSFGTFVNGERVAERVRVYAGDRVRLGEPGVELALIAVGEAAAGTAERD